MASPRPAPALPHGVTIDWCEDNYAVQTWVAEFWNTWTSVLCAAVFLVWLCQPSPPAAGAVPWLHLLFSFIFAGSAAFHGTLTWVGQLLDEVPIMAFCAFSLAVCFDNLSLQSGFKRSWWGLGPRVLAAACVAETMALTILYTLHTKAYGVFLTGVVVQAALHWPFMLYFIWKRTQWDRAALGMLAMHVGVGYSGAGLWLLENTFCSQLKALNLHAVWHITSTLALKPWVDLLVYCRLRAAGQEPHYRMRAWGLGPSFHVSAA